jgi:hypothetical protein
MDTGSNANIYKDNCSDIYSGTDSIVCDSVKFINKIGDKMYDSKFDRSEEFGWKKWEDEERCNEEEQNKWSKIIVIFAIVLSVLVLI